MNEALTSRQRQSGALAKLICLGAHAAHRPLVLRDKPVLAGTRAEAKIRLVSGLISRWHAMFLCTAEGVRVRDLASRTGFFVNDELIREALLRNGDRIRLGPFEFFVTHDRGAESADPEPPAAQLTTDVGPALPIQRRILVIGQRRECDLAIPGQDVSLAHAVIYPMNGRHILRDLNSRTGAFVNDRPVHEQELRIGDVVQIGGRRLRYQTQTSFAEPMAAVQRAG